MLCSGKIEIWAGEYHARCQTRNAFRYAMVDATTNWMANSEFTVWVRVQVLQSW